MKKSINGINGLFINAKLKGLRPVISNWLQVIHDYSASHSFEDALWWYNERASLSALAGAAWRTNKWSAMEEFATTKRGILPAHGVEEGQIKKGRCDLYISNASTGYAMEAKQAWQSIGERATSAYPKMWGALSQASKDAGNLTVDEAEHRVGAVFVCPYIPVNEVLKAGSTQRRPEIDRKLANELVEAWLKGLRLKTSGEVDGAAWIFPARSGRFIGANKKNYFPGTLLLLKRCDRGNRRKRSE